MTGTNILKPKSFILELRHTVPSKAVQRIGSEDSTNLHERLRDQAVSGFVSYRENVTLRITTPSWYTFDASRILGIPNVVAVSATTCKHHVPFVLFLGIRREDWQRRTSDNQNWIYTLGPLGRDLTLAEKNRIYDEM
jgi:hypothetical protein